VTNDFYGDPSDDGFDPPDDSEVALPAASPRRTLIDIVIEVRAALARAKEALVDLEMARLHAVTRPTSAVARQALIAAAAEVTFPLIDFPDDYRDLKQQAANGHLNTHAARALVSVEMEITALKCAEAALIVLDALGEPVQPTWSNQPLSHLARALTRYQHAITKRIPGLQ
jgi:hypothetical protein